MSEKQIIANRRIAESKRKKELFYDGMWWHVAGGYYRTTIDNKIIRLHRYIWEKHNGPIPKGMWVHHKDKNKLNNNIENLQLISNSEHSTLHQTGRKYSLEAREKMRQKAIANGSGFKKGHLVSLETREKLHDFNIGKHHTQESIEKMRISNSGEKNGFFGKHHTPETIARILETKRLNKLRKLSTC